MGASFSGWYNSATSQYSVVVDDSKPEMTKLIIREGRTSKIVEVPSAGDPFEIITPSLGTRPRATESRDRSKPSTHYLPTTSIKKRVITLKHKMCEDRA